MAGIAVQVLRVGGQRLLAWLGGGAVAGGGAVVVDDALRRQREAEAAREAAIARAHAQTQAQQRCERCPLCRGSLSARSTAGWSPVTVAYQLRIGGLGGGAGTINEWRYNGVDFDGVDLAGCVLKEAKAHYDQFFNLYGQPEAWWAEGRMKIIAEAVRQDLAAVPKPPVRLEWHFMEPQSYGYFIGEINAACPTIQVHLTP